MKSEILQEQGILKTIHTDSMKKIILNNQAVYIVNLCEEGKFILSVMKGEYYLENVHVFEVLKKLKLVRGVFVDIELAYDCVNKLNSKQQ